MAFSTDDITCTSIICTGPASFGSMTLPANSVLNSNIAPTAAIDRSKLALELLVAFPILLHSFRVWDAIATNLPGTAANDDLGYTGGTWGTNTQHLTSGDFEGTTITRRARVQIAMPENYVAAEDARIRIIAKMSAAAQVSATIDAEAFLTNYDGTVNGADIVATAAQSMNSTSLTNYDFIFGTGGLLPGTLLDIRITIAGDDTAGAGATAAIIGHAVLLCDIKG